MFYKNPLYLHNGYHRIAVVQTVGANIAEWLVQSIKKKHLRVFIPFLSNGGVKQNRPPCFLAPVVPVIPFLGRSKT